MNIEGNSPAEMLNLFGEEYACDCEDCESCDRAPAIKFKAAHDYNIPTQAHRGEWADLATAEDVDMKAGEFKIINLGVCMKIPAGTEAILAPRSSTYKKWHILQTNGVGVIDSLYSGDDDWWGFPALAMQDTHIPAGTRIAQFRFQPQMGQLMLKLVDKLDTKSRGGFGSTGD